MLNENSGIAYDDGYHYGYSSARSEIISNLELLCKDMWSVCMIDEETAVDCIEESENCFEFLKSRLIDNLEG